MRRFECVTDGHDKYWEIDGPTPIYESTQPGMVTSYAVTIRWGRIGTKGTGKTHNQWLRTFAEQFMRTAIAEKLARGYVEVVSARSQRTDPNVEKREAMLSAGFTWEIDRDSFVHEREGLAVSVEWVNAWPGTAASLRNALMCVLVGHSVVCRRNPIHDLWYCVVCEHCRQEFMRPNYHVAIPTLPSPSAVHRGWIPASNEIVAVSTPSGGNTWITAQTANEIRAAGPMTFGDLARELEAQSSAYRERYPRWTRKFFRSVPPDRLNVQAFGRAGGVHAGDAFLGEHQVMDVAWGPRGMLGGAVRLVRAILLECGKSALADDDRAVAWAAIEIAHDLPETWSISSEKIEDWMLRISRARATGSMAGTHERAVEVAREARMGTLPAAEGSGQAPPDPGTPRRPGARRVVARRPPEPEA